MTIIRLNDRAAHTEFIMNKKLAKADTTKFHSMTHKQHPAIPEGWIYVCDSDDRLVRKYNMHPTAPAPRKKNRAYTIIDQFGSLDSTETLSKAYAIAKSISIHPKEHTYTLKGFCKMLSNNPNTQVSDKQKNMVRFNFNPSQVIVIVSALTPQVQWRIDQWVEKADHITVIEVEDINHIEIHTLKDMHPEYFAATESTDSKARRCANIWSNALGWQFSAPLYRDNSREMDEMYLKRNDRNNYDDTAHLTKIASRPASYINSKIAVAPERECQEFFVYYAYLQQNKLLAEFLEPGYELCPHCHRPVRTGQSNTMHCSYCEFEAEDYELNPYFEDSYRDEE